MDPKQARYFKLRFTTQLKIQFTVPISVFLNSYTFLMILHTAASVFLLYSAI